MFLSVAGLVLGELIRGILGFVLAITLTAILKISGTKIVARKLSGFLIGNFDTINAGPNRTMRIKNKFTK